MPTAYLLNRKIASARSTAKSIPWAVLVNSAVTKASRQALRVKISSTARAPESSAQSSVKPGATHRSKNRTRAAAGRCSASGPSKMPPRWASSSASSASIAASWRT